MEMIDIFESEIKLMNKIWQNGRIKAIDLANYATNEFGWKKSTTYSILRPMVAKGVIQREEPNFVITPLVSKEQVAAWKLQEVADILYGGNVILLIESAGFNNFAEIHTRKELHGRK